jgi:FecR-like protein
MKLLKSALIASGIFLIWVLLLDPANRAAAADKPAVTDGPAGEAELTLLEGMASLLDKDGKPARPLVLGDRYRPGDRIRTGNKARISLRFQDGSHIRFSEFTTVELVSLKVTETPKERNIRIQLLSGDVWINATAPYTGKGSLGIIVPKAAVKTTQSISRFTVFSDKATLLKAYQGHLEIRNLKKNTPVPTKKGAWIHLVNPMHQLYVRSNGTATNPFRFMIKADENNWVQWNRTQDANIGTPGQ